jgi:hypothetical protein
MMKKEEKTIDYSNNYHFSLDYNSGADGCGEGKEEQDERKAEEKEKGEPDRTLFSDSRFELGDNFASLELPHLQPPFPFPPPLHLPAAQSLRPMYDHKTQSYTLMETNPMPNANDDSFEDKSARSPTKVDVDPSTSSFPVTSVRRREVERVIPRPNQPDEPEMIDMEEQHRHSGEIENRGGNSNKPAKRHQSPFSDGDSEGRWNGSVFRFISKQFRTGWTATRFVMILMLCFVAMIFVINAGWLSHGALLFHGLYTTLSVPLFPRDPNDGILAPLFQAKPTEHYEKGGEVKKGKGGEEPWKKGFVAEPRSPSAYQKRDKDPGGSEGSLDSDQKNRAALEHRSGRPGPGFAAVPSRGPDALVEAPSFASESPPREASAKQKDRNNGSERCDDLRQPMLELILSELGQPLNDYLWQLTINLTRSSSLPSTSPSSLFSSKRTKNEYGTDGGPEWISAYFSFPKTIKENLRAKLDLDFRMRRKSFDLENCTKTGSPTSNKDSIKCNNKTREHRQQKSPDQNPFDSNKKHEKLLAEKIEESLTRLIEKIVVDGPKYRCCCSFLQLPSHQTSKERQLQQQQQQQRQIIKEKESTPQHPLAPEVNKCGPSWVGVRKEKWSFDPRKMGTNENDDVDDLDRDDNEKEAKEYQEEYENEFEKDPLFCRLIAQPISNDSTENILYLHLGVKRELIPVYPASEEPTKDIECSLQLVLDETVQDLL